MKELLSLWLLPLFCISWLDAKILVVQVSKGILEGTIQESRNGRQYSAFLGIPYAEPPTGNLRFKNPVPAKKWDGIRLAVSHGNMCPQEYDSKLIGNEDCLFLNVYSPMIEYNPKTVMDESQNQYVEENDKTMLPVMVWIHGGAFAFGSSNAFHAEYLLDKNIVLVTINYRLGIFGFFSTGDAVSPGNFGLKDQRLALEWVQENIKAFGGDPKRVTIFGESAGGFSVGLHALSEASNGLFQQFIIQSGSPLCPWGYQDRSRYKSHSEKLGALFDCSSHNSEQLVDCLRTKNVDELVKAINSMGEMVEYDKFTWIPTNEPEAHGAFLTDSPKNLIERNQMKDLPFIIGHTSDEAKFLTGVYHASSSACNEGRHKATSIISKMGSYYEEPEAISSFVSAVDKYYFNSTLNSITTSSDDEFIESFTRYVSDFYFLYPGVRMLERVVPTMKNPAYFYSFGYRGSGSMTNKLTGDNRNVGVSHADEINYLFPDFLVLIGGPKMKTTKLDKAVIDLMVDLWTSFASNGKPTSRKLLNPDLWAPYTVEKPKYLQIGDINNNTEPTVTLSESYYKSRMDFWREQTPSV